MKVQLFICGFLPGVTAAVLTTQPSLAASLQMGKFDHERLKILDPAFEDGKPSDGQTKLSLGSVGITLPDNHTDKSISRMELVTEIALRPQRDRNGNTENTKLINLSNPQFAPVGEEKKTGLENSTNLPDPTTAIAKSSNVLINTLKNRNVQSQGKPASHRPAEVSPPEPISVSQIKANNIPNANQLMKPVGNAPVGKKCENQRHSQQSCLSANPGKNQQLVQNTPTSPNIPSGGTRVNPSVKRYTPNPNPLLFPTKSPEVQVKENRIISLSEALEIARRNNTDLQTSLLQLQASQAALRQAQASLFPTLNLNTSISRQQSASGQLQNEGTPEFFRQPGADSPSTAFTSDLQLNYSLYTSGARRATIREAEEQVRASELSVEQRSEEIRLNVTTQYYNLQQTDQSVRIATSAVRNSQKSLEDAQALERAGVGTKFDVLRSQVTLANAQQDLTNAIASQQVEQRRFAFLLNLPQTVTLRAVEEVKIAGLWERNLEDTIILAFQNRPELQQQLAQREINEQRRRQALSQKGPQVSLLASYDLLDQFDDGIAVTDGYSIAVRATLNLFDGGSARAQAAQAKANIAIAENNFSAQRNQVRFDVEQFFAELESNLKNVNTATTALEQAREALRLARLRFQAGVGTQTDVINSENDLTRAEGNRINAILDYNRALANLERAVTLRSQPEVRRGQ